MANKSILAWAVLFGLVAAVFSYWSLLIHPTFCKNVEEARCVTLWPAMLVISGFAGAAFFYIALASTAIRRPTAVAIVGVAALVTVVYIVTNPTEAQRLAVENQREAAQFDKILAANHSPKERLDACLGFAKGTGSRWRCVADSAERLKMTGKDCAFLKEESDKDSCLAGLVRNLTDVTVTDLCTEAGFTGHGYETCLRRTVRLENGLPPGVEPFAYAEPGYDTLKRVLARKGEKQP